MRSEILSTPRAWQTFLTSLGYQWDDLNLRHIYESWPLPPRISQHYAKRIDWTNPNDPLYLQIVPQQNERETRAYEQTDPIGDHEHEVTPGLIHRYPNRVLLWPHLACSIHCRFCFRREDVGGVPHDINWEKITEYIQAHPQIEEVILSGGDPAMLSEMSLARLVDRLINIPHITTLRLHSRALAADPDAVTLEKIKILEGFSRQSGGGSIGHNRDNKEGKNATLDRKVVWVHHVNHAQELSPEGAALSQALREHNIEEFSQSVLLAGVNDNVQALTELFTGLSRQKIKPYYLHHLDPAQGIHHFRVSIEEGLAIYRALRGKLAGYLLPQYMVELPRGQGKVPVEQLRAVAEQPGVYEVLSPVSKTMVRYRDPFVADQTR